MSTIPKRKRQLASTTNSDDTVPHLPPGMMQPRKTLKQKTKKAQLFEEEEVNASTSSAPDTTHSDASDSSDAEDSNKYAAEENVSSESEDENAGAESDSSEDDFEQQEDAFYVSDDEISENESVGVPEDPDEEIDREAQSILVGADIDPTDAEGDDTVQVLEVYKGDSGVRDVSKTVLFHDADSEDDSSEDESVKNTIGNVPMHWYDDYDHIGYDRDGKPIMRKKKKDTLDHLIARHDDPNYIRTVYDELNDEDIVLTNQDLEMLMRIQQGKFPDPSYNPYENAVDYVEHDSRVPLTGVDAPKKSFIPSKTEAKKVREILRKMRRGGGRPDPRQDKPKLYLLWGEDGKAVGEYSRMPLIPVPKQTLPGHGQSYNPPAEYITGDRVKYDCLRHVPAYNNYVMDRFNRCLDLYLAPRQIIKKKTVPDPDKLLPELPKPDELRPFPTMQSVVYKGHRDAVRTITVDPSGYWMASGSDDHKVRLWEVDTGRCVRIWTFSEVIRSVAWCPNADLNILLVAFDNKIVVVEPPETSTPEKLQHTAAVITKIKDSINARKEVEMRSKYTQPKPKPEKKQFETGTTPEEDARLQKKFAKTGEITISGRNIPENDEPIDPSDDADVNEDKKIACWELFTSETDRAHGLICSIAVHKKVTQVTWHHKGDYFASVSPEAYSRGAIVHQLSKTASQTPFKKKKQTKAGSKLVRILFHVSEPLIYVVYEQRVRVYDLMRQKLVKRMKGNCRYISSMDLHPSGNHIIIGGYDKRLEWFDMELTSRPYRTLRFHKKAIRSVAFHRRYPLFATASDDGTTEIFHASVFDDWLKDPLIVPVKILRGHKIAHDLGVLDCLFHPSQPWIFTSGADGRIRLYTS